MFRNKLQDVLKMNREKAAKILFPEYFDNYVRQTFYAPEETEVESLKCFIEDYNLNKKFNFTIVGSILNPHVRSNDLDVVLTNRDGGTTLIELEETFIRLRLFGLQELYCDLDISYRTIGENQLFNKVYHKRHFYTWFLKNPVFEQFAKKHQVRYKSLRKMIVAERSPEIAKTHPKAIRINRKTNTLKKSQLLKW